MTSRSATVLVIFVIAIFAFCLASVFAAMTGPISILPNESESGGILDNLSAFTDDINTDNTYGYQQDDYSNYDYSDDSNVETTTDDSSSQSTDSDNIETTTDDSSSGSNNGGGDGSSSNIETTVDQ